MQDWDTLSQSDELHSLLSLAPLPLAHALVTLFVFNSTHSSHSSHPRSQVSVPARLLQFSGQSLRDSFGSVFCGACVCVVPNIKGTIVKHLGTVKHRAKLIQFNAKTTEVDDSVCVVVGLGVRWHQVSEALPHNAARVGQGEAVRRVRHHSHCQWHAELS